MKLVRDYLSKSSFKSQSMVDLFKPKQISLSEIIVQSLLLEKLEGSIDYGE